jgi:hypothetical protein
MGKTGLIVCIDLAADSHIDTLRWRGEPFRDRLLIADPDRSLSAQLTFGLSPLESIGTIDRLTAALAEIRAHLVAQLGHDPAAGQELCDCVNPVCPKAHPVDAERVPA